jgi:glycosyltransferase involved in cell wall biosynthesis
MMTTGGENESAAAPMVSVIVPSYNHARFLRERMESIFAQTFTDYEVILLDDCSTDGSAEILREYAGRPQVRCLLVNETNSASTFKQWAKGLALAKGKYIWIAETDDVAAPHFLAKLVVMMEEDLGCVLAYCRTANIDEDGQPITVFRYYPEEMDPVRWTRPFRNEGKLEIKDYLAYRCTIPNASAALIRAEAMRSVAIPEGMRYSGDWLFYLRLLELGGLAYCESPLCRQRLHEGTTRLTGTAKKAGQRMGEILRVLSAASLPWQPCYAVGRKDHEHFLRALVIPFPSVIWRVWPTRGVSPLLKLKFTWSAIRRLAAAQLEVLRPPRKHCEGLTNHGCSAGKVRGDG